MSHHIRPHLDRARRLIEAGDEQSLVYAALELRLGLELVCYSKLQMRLRYVSADEIADWRPREVLKALEELADPDIFRAAILEVAAEPVSEEPKTWSRICERRAMDPGRLRSIWNQLGNYLHVRQPEDRHTLMKAYPDACSLKKSLLELLDELAPLASGSDIHFVKERTYFHCSCGFRVERSSATLRDSQLVTCINPKCRKEWVVQERQGQYRFESNVIDVPCRRCDHQQPLAQRDVREMRPGQRYRFTCDACGAAHWVRCSFDYALADEASTA